MSNAKHMRTSSQFPLNIISRCTGILVAAGMSVAAAFGQLSVSPQSDLNALAAAITGPGVAISNPQVTCHAEGYGEFSYAGSLLGSIQEGVILTSGRITEAIGPNNVENRSFQQGTPGNSILNTVTGRTTYDACMFEFDVVPSGDTMRFNFVMGSEEYNEWVGSQYNDVFGFFISGPGIAGDPGIGSDKNIALIPGTSQAVTINNVNNGSNQAHYYDNAGGSQLQYDGLTVGLSAVSVVQPCQTYHLKLIVADASDRKFDSGVFIERIESNAVTMSAATINGMSNMIEGCNSGVVRFTRQNVTASALDVPYFLGGSALNGTDYAQIGDPDPLVARIATIPGGQAFVDVTLDPIADGVIEPIETATVYLSTSTCPGAIIDSLTISIQDSLIATISAPAQLCIGSSTGLQADGGYDYTWSPGTGLSATNVPDPLASPITSQNYSVTISAGACQEVLSTTVTVSNLTLSASTVQPLCQGGSNGAIDLSVIGGIPPYSYSWSGPGGYAFQGQDPTGIVAGTYSVTVTDQANCSRVQSFNVGAPATLAIQLTPSLLPFGQHISCQGGSDGAITSTITGGTGPYQVLWSGPNGFTSTSVNLSSLLAGTYSVNVTDANGCAASASTTLVEPPAFTSQIVDPIHVACFGGNTGSATIAPQGGIPPYSVEWNTLPAQTAMTATGLIAGAWTATVTDGYGCTSSALATIDQPAEALQASIQSTSSETCDDQANGSATVHATGGTTPYTFGWNTSPVQSSAAASGLSAGNYTVTVTDANNCTAAAQATVNGPAAQLVATLDQLLPESCFGSSNGSASIVVQGGGTPYAITWNTLPPTTGQVASGLTAGNYTATVQDAFGCTTTVDVAIPGPAGSLDLEPGPVQHETCFGAADGTATVVSTGGTPTYSVSWNTIPAQTGNTATGLSAGTYTATVTDANGCSDQRTIVINGPAAAVNIGIVSTTPVLCHGASTGMATVQVSGGMPPLNVEWNTAPVQTGTTASGLAAGTYTATVTDANGCANSISVTITQPNAPLQASIASMVPVSCHNGADGSISLAISGGSGAYAISWNSIPVQTGPVATGLELGIYTATIADLNGCAAPVTVQGTVSQPSQPLFADILVDDNGGFSVSCAGGNDGKIAMTPLGGTAPYSTLWTDEDGNTTTDQTLLGLTAGTYTLLLTDANGCTYTTSVTLTEPSPLVISGTVSPAACQGASDGAVDASIGGGIPPYQIAWSGPNGFNSTNSDIDNIEAGIYVLTVTDQHGCVSTMSFDVGQPGLFTVSAITSTTPTGHAVSCIGASDGSIDLTLGGASPPYNVMWSGPAGFTSSQEDISSLMAGTYQVTITDANGCSTIASYSLQAPPPITVALTPALTPGGTAISCQGANDGTINGTVAGGGSPLNLAWTGPNGYTSLLEDISGLAPGTYQLTATNANGCTGSASIALTAPSTLSATATLSTHPGGQAISCHGANDGSIQLNISGGSPTYTVSWSGPNGSNYSGTSINGLVAGDYSATITDSNGCSAQLDVTLDEPALLTASATIPDLNGSPIGCAGGSDGSIDLQIIGGSAIASILWTGPNGFVSNNEDLSGLGAGTYSVLVNDINGCAWNDMFTLDAPLPLDAQLVPEHVACSGGLSGSVELTINGGTAPFQTDWTGPQSYTSTDEDLAGLEAGTYTVLITDANGCSLQQSSTVTMPDALELIANTSSFAGGIQVSCATASDGSIDLDILGGTAPYFISWSSGTGFSSNTEDLTGLPPGNYQVSVTDGNGCSSDLTIQLDAPAPIAMSATISDHNGSGVSCQGAQDGSIDLDVVGGTGPYSISWSNGANSEDLSAIGAGSYTVNISDQNGCTATATYLLDSPVSVTTSLSAPDQGGAHVTCNNGSDGSIDLAIGGGLAPYTIAWNGPNSFSSDQEDISGLTQGTYQVQVTDANGCTAVSSITLTAPPALTPFLSATAFNNGYHIPCAGANSGSIMSSVSGGVPAYTLDWSGPGGALPSTPQQNGLGAGTYTLQVTDANGCTASTFLELLEPSPIVAVGIPSDAGLGYQVGCSGNDGAIDLTVSGGTPAYQFNWNGPGGSAYGTEDLSGLHAGIYDLQIIDANGCSSDLTVTLNAPPALAISAISVAPLCHGTNEGSIDLSITGGAGVSSVLWTLPDSSTSSAQDLNDLFAGSYAVVVTDELGCVQQSTIDLNGPAPL
ncbi:MAG: SprB repeat-containing protein, partial [Flavobacteriales bacterium]|nr:SprB repeat-containing protein [Flavobacteriales bacterium]